MKSWLAFGCAIGLLAGCGDEGGSSGSGGAGGTGGAGGSVAGGAGGSVANGGTNTGGAGGSSGSGGATGGTGGAAGGTGGAGGSGGASGGSAGAGGSGGSGGGTQAWQCPAGPFDAPSLSGTPTRITTAPPQDGFNDNGFGNVEGPVWIGDALYFSEIGGSPNPPPSRILKLNPDESVTVVNPDSGTNGLAVNANGELFGAVHKDGSVSKLSLSGGAAMAVVSEFMSARFNSPNDLTIRSDGTIYFSDPVFQAPQPNPQQQQRVYRIAPGSSTAEPVITDFNQPNGVTLSLDESTLYVSGGGLKKYPVNADGSLGTGSDFTTTGGSGDGMVVDCAGNLYVAADNVVSVYTSAGQKIADISALDGLRATNVAFGGTEHKTLYITGMGNYGQRGVLKLEMNLPGMPY